MHARLLYDVFTDTFTMLKALYDPNNKHSLCQRTFTTALFVLVFFFFILVVSFSRLSPKDVFPPYILPKMCLENRFLLLKSMIMSTMLQWVYENVTCVSELNHMVGFSKAKRIQQIRKCLTSEAMLMLTFI